MNTNPVRVKHCQFETRCEKNWDDLEQIGHDDIRHCNTCHQSVVQCYNQKELDAAIAARRCVAVDPAILGEEASMELVVGMMEDPPLDAAVGPAKRHRAAYLATTYRIDGRIPVKIGHKNKQLPKFVTKNAVKQWAIVTAFNPGSVVSSGTKNMERQREFEAEVIASGYKTFPATGEPTKGSGWAPERSLFIWDIDADAAMELGRDHGQNAIVVSTEDGRGAKLVYCDPRANESID